MSNSEAIKGVQSIRNGLREDVNNLIEDFDRMASVRFVDFSRLWKERHLSWIFTYKLNIIDMREFIEDAYQIILDQLNRSAKPERAILILYLIYCFYMCQPITPKIPIKLNLSKFKAFRYLFQESRVNKHLDACYIWMKLLSLGAFHMVDQTKAYGPLAMKKDPTLGASSSSTNNFSLDRTCEIQTEMEKVKNLHYSYLALKDSLEGPDAENVKALSLVRDEFFDQFANILEKSAEEESNLNNQEESSALVPY